MCVYIYVFVCIVTIDNCSESIESRNNNSKNIKSKIISVKGTLHYIF